MGVLGPHEGKELELMLKGQKNISLFFSDYGIPEVFSPYIESGMFKLRTVEVELIEQLEYPFSYYIIYKNGYSGDVDYLISLLKEGRDKFNPAIERKIGELLGYDNEDIEFYIANFIEFFKNEREETFS